MIRWRTYQPGRSWVRDAGVGERAIWPTDDPRQRWSRAWAAAMIWVAGVKRVVVLMEHNAKERQARRFQAVRPGR